MVTSTAAGIAPRPERPWPGRDLHPLELRLSTAHLGRHNLVRRTIRQFGRPRFLITDHGSQFRRRFHEQVEGWGVHHVRNRVRTPYLNGKMERAFRTFKLWWRMILTGCTTTSIQRRLDNYRHWYNTARIHSSLGVRTPEEAWSGASAPEPQPIRAADPQRYQIQVTRSKCRGDPRLRVLQITLRRAA